MLELFSVDRGAGQSIVLLHGWGQDHRSWDAVAEALATRYRVIAMDLGGHGQSTGSETDFIAFAAQVSASLDRLGIDAPFLVGHSLGGMVVQQLLADAPNRYAGAVILDADLNVGLVRLMMQAMGWLGHRVMRILGQQSLAISAVLLGLVWYSTTWRRVHPERVAEARAAFRENAVIGLATSFEAYACRPDLSDALGSAPRTLLIRGEHDLIMSRAKMDALKRALPEATLIELKGAGHMTPNERPDEVADLIERFIDS